MAVTADTVCNMNKNNLSLNVWDSVAAMHQHCTRQEFEKHCCMLEKEEHKTLPSSTDAHCFCKNLTS